MQFDSVDILRDSSMNRMGSRILKRSFDFVFSLVFLCTLFPVILVIVIIVTECTMPGNPFFVQKRTGLKGRIFSCYKFRTMRKNEDSDSLQATKDDCRTTRWGHILRMTNIDETPQFINVLLGDMSVVGPRPHMVKHTEEFSRIIDGFVIRHTVKPGVTGWSQMDGLRGEIRSLIDMRLRVKYDIWYIRHWSFYLDLYIIVKTFFKCFGNDSNAY